MKKLLAIFAAITIIAIILFMLVGLGLGFGKGSASGEGEGEPSASQQVDESAKEADEETKDDSAEGSAIKVAVVKSEYFYENRRIELDALLEIIGAIEGNFIVEVTDDNAALKAYKKLLDKLDELEIPYNEVVAD